MEHHPEFFLSFPTDGGNEFEGEGMASTSIFQLFTQKHQTWQLAIHHPEGKPPRLLVKHYLCAQWHLSLAKPTPFIFNELQLTSSRCSFKSLLAWQPYKQQGMCTRKKKNVIKKFSWSHLSKRKGMLRYCRWESRWLSPSYLFRLLVLLSVVGNIT